MFCPKCGKSEQSPETYCRQCGNYLQDYTKPAKRENTPEQHLKANIFSESFDCGHESDAGNFALCNVSRQRRYADYYLHHGRFFDGDDGLADPDILADTSFEKTL